MVHKAKVPFMVYWTFNAPLPSITNRLFQL